MGMTKNGHSTHLQGREVVIVEAARTAVGRGHREKGAFKDVHPNELLGATYKAVIEAGLAQGRALMRSTGRKAA